jgi:hypothetical protein
MEFRLFRGTDNFRDSVPLKKNGGTLLEFFLKHIEEENLLSILFAGTRNFLIESISPNAAAENFKKIVCKFAVCGLLRKIACPPLHLAML